MTASKGKQRLYRLLQTAKSKLPLKPSTPAQLSDVRPDQLLPSSSSTSTAKLAESAMRTPAHFLLTSLLDQTSLNENSESALSKLSELHLAGRTLAVLFKVGRELGREAYHASIAACVENADRTHDKDAALKDIAKAIRLFNEMRERFVLREAAYGPLLLYFADRGMVDKFFFFCDSIKEEESVSLPRLGYYEMLLWMKVDDEDKLQELCEFALFDDRVDTLELRENYLSALCECDRKDQLGRLLEMLGLTQFSSLANMFKSLGKLSVEPLVEKFLLRFGARDHMVNFISDLIFSHSATIPNLATEVVLEKYESLHKRMDIVPSCSSYAKLISYCCDSKKVDLALGIVDQMCDAGYSCSIDSLHRILHICEDTTDNLYLVRRIYSLICQHNIKANAETIRSMIEMYVRMKDFEGALSLFDDAKKMNVTTKASFYNSIMGGYFREKRVSDALTVLKQMELDSVKPDSRTYCLLIRNSGNEEDILKFYDKWKSTRVRPTKHIFMALIYAYASIGEFKKAKQVLLDKDIPLSCRSELKSVLIRALASSGGASDAIAVYKEFKEASGNLTPEAVISMIENSKSDGDLSLMLQLLQEFQDHEYWVDACCRVVAFCIENKHFRCAIDLLKQWRDRCRDDEFAIEFLFNEVFAVVAELDPPDVQISVDLLQAVKDEFGLTPQRICLDFILNACTNAKDLNASHFIWEEYKKAGYEYNVVNYLRMYKGLLACGDHKSAEELLPRIPNKEDCSVRYIIELCQDTYLKSTSTKAKGS